MAKAKKATSQDAQVLIQLYDLRREPVLRAARKYMAFEFWPQHYDSSRSTASRFSCLPNMATTWSSYAKNTFLIFS